MVVWFTPTSYRYDCRASREFTDFTASHFRLALEAMECPHGVRAASESLPLQQQMTHLQTVKFSGMWAILMEILSGHTYANLLGLARMQIAATLEMNRRISHLRPFHCWLNVLHMWQILKAFVSCMDKGIHTAVLVLDSTMFCAQANSQEGYSSLRLSVCALITFCSFKTL